MGQILSLLQIIYISPPLYKQSQNKLNYFMILKEFMITIDKICTCKNKSKTQSSFKPSPLGYSISLHLLTYLYKFTE